MMVTMKLMPDRVEPTPLISGAVGVRYLGGEWEMYFAPKLVAFYCLEYAN